MSLRKIYDNGEILEDLSKPIFSVLSKKPDVNDCNTMKTQLNKLGFLIVNVAELNKKIDKNNAALFKTLEQEMLIFMIGMLSSKK